MTLSERGVEEPTVSLRHLLTGRKPVLGGTSRLSLSDYTEQIVASHFPGLRGLSPRVLAFQLES